jgi:peptide/nickel transport system permease protein
MTGSLYTIDDFGEGSTMQLKNIILPAFTLGIRPLSVVVQLARSSFLDVLSQDFIRTARAKGLSNRAVLINHALRNAMNPVVTAVSGWFAGLLAGAVFIEYIFGWKGLGKEIVDALENYDFPVVMGGVLVISLAFVIINILVDIIYGVLDPRVSLK